MGTPKGTVLTMSNVSSTWKNKFDAVPDKNNY